MSKFDINYYTCLIFITFIDHSSQAQSTSTVEFVNKAYESGDEPAAEIKIEVSDSFKQNSSRINKLENNDTNDDESEDENENIEDSKNLGSYIVKMRACLNEFFKKV